MPPQYIILPEKATDLTSRQFGCLIVLGPIRRTNQGKFVWLCKCECENLTEVQGGNLTSGHTRSCGCFSTESRKTRSITHGMRSHPLYPIWRNIVDRCTNHHNSAYAYYGERGIVVCDEWQHNFQAFCDHVSPLEYFGKEDYSLDRIDNSLGYQPGNVRWASKSQQQRNTRSNRLLTYNGKTQCIAAWAEEYNLSYMKLYNRLLHRGWSLERALAK